MSAVTRTFAAWLKAERERAGMSQDQLAHTLRTKGVRITQSQLAKIERVERVAMPLDLLVAVTAVFGATPDVALGLAADDRTDTEHALRSHLARRDRFLDAMATLAASELRHTPPAAPAAAVGARRHTPTTPPEEG